MDVVIFMCVLLGTALYIVVFVCLLSPCFCMPTPTLFPTSLYTFLKVHVLTYRFQ